MIWDEDCFGNDYPNSHNDSIKLKGSKILCIFDDFPLEYLKEEEFGLSMTISYFLCELVFLVDFLSVRKDRSYSVS